ncbi:hypothetical protein CC80DRAFT_438829 [Byssothecium circinans]|uniref:Uncharacterized protein n=1 Tax=Byssothecium circinans TaxID=147558 RepID=A0A6A5U8B5_9PLEO|nr:hypothetical protein CC80DRAFT_438829 [Byssothecium circinans]
MPGFLGKSSGASLVFDQDVTVDEKGDLIITLLTPFENGEKHVTEILVSTEVCMKSVYLKPILSGADDPTEITLGGEAKREGANKHGEEEGEDKEGVLVWLAHLHKMSHERMAELGLHEISVTSIWHAMRWWKYQERENDMKALQPWFNKWYDNLAGKALDIDMARLLALPCQIFDHAVGFARVTKYLAYNNVGHIKERQPKGFKHKLMHLAPNDFVGPTNHARGGLKTTLHKNLWKKAGNVLRFDTGKCDCWDATVGRYLGALVAVNAFPIEDIINRSSINDIVKRLNDFELNWNPKCNRCKSVDWLYVVRKTVSATEAYFDGLCLDCMDRSKPKGKDLDAEYWEHNSSYNGRWDRRCRVKHNQSTWYVSWLGRDDTRQKLLKGDSGSYRPDENS